MAIFTKYREKLLNGSLRIDQECIFDEEIVKVWGMVDGETFEKLYWISDLRGDKKRELRDVIESNLKKGQLKV